MRKCKLVDCQRKVQVICQFSHQAPFRSVDGKHADDQILIEQQKII